MAANASSDPHTLDAKHKLYEMILSFAKPMTLKAAVLLNIPDIIASEGHGASLSLQQIAAHISPPPQSMEYLLRILRFLASYDVFTESVHVVRGEEKQWSFGLTAISELLVQKGNQHSLAPFLLLVADKFLCESYHHLDESVLEGCSAFNKVYSKSPWEYLSEHPNCNKTFNDAMVSHTCALMASALKIYDGFKDVKTVVDVGGGVGTAISIIVKHHTHLKGINFDLPHVIDTAPAIPGVEHVGGNMFEQIPPADAVFIKSILHDWNDEHCVRILKKCREAIPENGKVIIVETVVERNEGSLRHLGLLFDIGMMTFTSGGKERTEEEFKVLFEKAGFKSYALLNLPAIESIIEACGNNKALPEGKLVHAHIIHTWFQCEDSFLWNNLVIMYTKCGSLLDARKVLDQMPKPNVVSWSVMISAYTKYGFAGEALALFYQMQRAGIQPNQFTFSSVLTATANLAALKQGKEFHEDIIRSGFQSDIFVGSTLVDMYAKCGALENARKVFDQMPERNAVSWNSMIAGYAQNQNVEGAMKLFCKMPERNVVSWTAMIAGYAQNGHLEEALKLFEKMPERNVVSWTAMVAGYVQYGYLAEALKLFQEMPERNVVSWTAIIAGYAQNECFGEAMQFFREMRLTGVKPDADTFGCILSSCASMAALGYGKEVHEDIIRSGFLTGVFVGNALIDMYAKCGNIKDAHQVFDKMSTRDIVSWNAMIVGYAMHGCGKEALKLFEQMQHSATNPDHVTFIGVLSACCHAGLVDDGWQYFDCMRQYYQITPGLDHYCCMVDLLGRAGRLIEAQDLIDKMPIEADVAVWVSLLGACKIHANIELGERVAEHLFELNPQNVAPYVLLSNIYSAAGRWDDSVKIQNMMKDRKVKKKPGCSWIEINNRLNAFLAGD